MFIKSNHQGQVKLVQISYTNGMPFKINAIAVGKTEQQQQICLWKKENNSTTTAQQQHNNNRRKKTTRNLISSTTEKWIFWPFVFNWKMIATATTAATTTFNKSLWLFSCLRFTRSYKLKCFEKSTCMKMITFLLFCVIRNELKYCKREEMEFIYCFAILSHLLFH